MIRYMWHKTVAPLLMVLIVPTILSCATGGSTAATERGDLFAATLPPERDEGVPVDEGGELREETEAQSGDESSQDDTDTPQPAEDTEPTLVISSDPLGADVYLNGSYLGTTPIETDLPQRGVHSVRIYHEGYRESSLRLDVGAREPHEVFATLDPVYGEVWVTVSPPEARVESVSPGVGEFEPVPDSRGVYRGRLLIGERRIRISRFGYADAYASLTVTEGGEHPLSVELRPVPFAVASVDLSRRSVNPHLPGLLATVSATVRITGPGVAVVSLLDAIGSELYASAPIDVKGERNRFSIAAAHLSGLADGSYVVRVGAVSAAGNERSIRDVPITISRAGALRHSSPHAAFHGTILAPWGRHVSLGYGSFSFAAMAHRGVAGGLRAPISLALVHAPSRRVQLRGYGTVEVTDSARQNSVRAGGSLSLALVDSPVFALRGVLRGAVQPVGYLPTGPRPDTFGAFPGGSLTIAAEVNLGPLVVLFAPEVSVSPGAPAYADDSPAEFAVWGYGRAGVGVRFAGLGYLGVSLLLRTDSFQSGLRLGSPFSLAGELALPLGGVVFSADAVIEAESVDSFYVMAGAGFHVPY